MQRLIMAAVLTGLMVSSLSDLGRARQPRLPDKPPQDRYDIFLTHAEGLRFIYPEGYYVDSATAYRSPDPNSALQKSWEIWKAADYRPWGGRYPAEPAGSEPPPHISLEILRNPEAKPLQQWMESPTSPAMPKIVAGQPAIAYRATGLYEYDVVLLNHPNGDVVKLQVGYLDAADPLRSVFQVVLDSLTFDHITAEGRIRSVNYRPLIAALKTGNWQMANLETRAILMQLMPESGYFYPHLQGADIQSLPCQEVQQLDAAWQRHSDGKFGFSVQSQIWNSVPAPRQVESFGNQVGWRQLPAADLSPLRTPWKFDSNLTYSTEAPLGHLPWLGVSSLQLERMLANSGAGCGSCTVDAMYLSSDRFGDFLPAFMSRVNACLSQDPSPVLSD
ncbi:GUN4 domain-containing protein [Lyngbya confervoides]|uniref:GUN4 domain-containing protein n=1 Tax=Lyngbya confervoides BDU141951 TaxID=1574623 RepID=A0ABD4T6X5_9CYAN|nr:GUN4 domain-containing protein [Lyngbya confervoides]MCM1984322.1 GUN4 domain-containing protein [Lyngbya confervoides BDU141951]